jgi:hypothetical protein
MTKVCTNAPIVRVHVEDSIYQLVRSLIRSLQSHIYIGHIIPSTATWLQFFKTYFTSYEEDSSVRPADVRSPTPAAQGPHDETADAGQEYPSPRSSRL